MSKIVFKNALFYALVDYFPMVTSLLLLPIYSSYLSPEDIGKIALLQVFVSLGTIFLSLQLTGGFSRLIVDYVKDPERLKSYIFTTWVFTFCLSLILGCCFHLFGDALVGLLFKRSGMSYAPLFQMALGTVFFSIISSLFRAVLRFEEKGAQFLAISIGVTFFSVATYFYAVVVLEKGVFGATAATLASSFVSMLAYGWYTRRNLLGRFNRSFIRPTLMLSMPLIPHAMMGFVFMYSDRIVLERFIPVAAIGIYAFSDRIASIAKTFAESINNAYTPNALKGFAVNREEGLEHFAILMTRFTALGLILSAALVLGINELLHFFVNPRFGDARIYVQILVLAYAFRMLYGFTGMALIQAKKMVLLPVISLASGVANLTLNLIFVERFGILATSLTTVLAFLIQAVAAFLYSQKYFPLKYEWLRLARLWGYFFLVYGLGLFVDMRFGFSWPAFFFKCALGLSLVWNNLESVGLNLSMLVRERKKLFV